MAPAPKWVRPLDAFDGFTVRVGEVLEHAPDFAPVEVPGVRLVCQRCSLDAGEWPDSIGLAELLAEAGAHRRACGSQRRLCPECHHVLMAPAPAGQPGEDSYYCSGCGRAWSLDLRRVVL